MSPDLRYCQNYAKIRTLHRPLPPSKINKINSLQAFSDISHTEKNTETYPPQSFPVKKIIKFSLQRASQSGTRANTHLVFNLTFDRQSRIGVVFIVEIFFRFMADENKALQ
jgi:hypothetical protein